MYPMKISPLLSSVLGALVLLSAPAQSQTVYNVELNYEPVNPAFWHIQWIGQVDTAADTFTITQWNMLDTSSSSSPVTVWTPVNLPIVLHAIDANRNAVDVPDTWDGTIGSDWAFVSLTNNADLPWNEGSHTGGINDAALGWGGYRPGSNGPNSDTFHYVSYNEDPALYIPNGVNSVQTFNWTSQSVTPVPEPSLAALLGLGGFFLILRKRSY
jgi:hypothetical protein